MRGRFTTPVRTSRCYTTAQSEMLSECGAWGGTRLRVAQFLANFWHGGVLFAHGARFGSHALYVKDNRLHYVYDFVGSLQQKVVHRHPGHPTGEDLILSASFDKQGEDPPGVATGILSLYHGDDKIGEAHIKTQPGKLSSAGKGCASAATAARPSPTTTRASRPGPSPAAPSSGSPSMSAASPTWT